MHIHRRLAVALAVLLCSAAGLHGQSIFNVTLRGTSYTTNGTERVITNLVTDQTILRELANAAGVADLKSWALVYHIAGSGFGDTIDVVDATTGRTLDTVFGFYFGDSLGRYALTNSIGNEVRRLDYIYTKQSPYALGSAFLTKRFTSDNAGHIRTSIDAEMHWLIRPQGNRGAFFCTATFTTTTPWTPRQ